MHLKSLTLRGFKSFATATTLRFEPGITCVVGPNGSGKSNVVDALAWVMGEQGAKSLRGGKMEDVVFAGTAGRPPLGRAEVVLTIDNADGALPLDHSEVTLTRTLFRNGSSEYAINGSPCRLLDLQELLSDSGIGREMHVVVGQGQLDTILRATPEDRRGFVEEAAGVLKHRRRKEKALRKLEGTDGNLLRLQDLLGEIRRQLKPLSRQAEVARRAAAVQSDARDARARLLADDITAAREGLAREVADETALRERRARVEAILSAAGREEAELDEVVRTMEPRLTRAQETWYRLSGLRERIGGLGDMAAERMRLSDNEPTETTRGVGSDDLAAQAAQVRDEAQRIGREVDGRREALDEAVGTRQEAEQAAAAADRRVADQARAHADRREGVARLRGAVNTSRTRVKAGEEELSRLEAVRSDAHERMQRASHDFTALETRVAGLSAGEGGLDAEHEGALSALSDVTQRLAKAREEAQLADRERAGLVARMEALQLSLTRRDGAAALLSAADRIPGLRGSVASLLRVRPGYETAVTAALGDAAGGVALDDCASAVGALTHLRERDLGRATVLMAGGPHADPGVHPLPDGATYALDAVEAPADLRPALQRLLGDVVVVADLAAARLLLQDRPEAVAVTKEGDVLGAHVAAGGSAGGPSLFALEVAHDEAREAHGAAVGTSERLRFEVTRWEGECVDAQRRVDVALASLHESDAALAAVVERLGQLGGAARAARAEVERVAGAIASAEGALATHRTELAAQAQRLDEAEDCADADADPDTSALDRLVAAAATARQTEVDARLTLRTSEERARALADRAEALVSAAATERESSSRLAARRAQQRLERTRAGAVLRAVTLVQARLDHSLELAATQRQALDEQRHQADVRLGRTRSRLKELTAEVDQLTGLVHRDEVARAEHRARIEQLERQSADDFGLEVESLLSGYGPALPVPVTSVDAVDGQPDQIPYVRIEQLERLRVAERSLAMLGRINPLALEEFEALEERHAFLAQQLDDVRRTRSDLLGIVGDVDARVEEAFSAAWHDTAREFAAVFARLFPGGEGRLVLTDPDDMLATGIEVEARPAGKTLKRLSLLSGGERSLVAVAFLVAIFKARPSPFYVLDEIEAALDDTNLSRLLGIYEELRSTSQLVVITHQKRTMEIADSLYGVSMRGDGISTVISQRLREAEPV